MKDFAGNAMEERKIFRSDAMCSVQIQYCRLILQQVPRIPQDLRSLETLARLRRPQGITATTNTSIILTPNSMLTVLHPLVNSKVWFCKQFCKINELCNGKCAQSHKFIPQCTIQQSQPSMMLLVIQKKQSKIGPTTTCANNWEGHMLENYIWREGTRRYIGAVGGAVTETVVMDSNEYLKIGCSIEFVTDKLQEGSHFCIGFGGILLYQLDMRTFDDLSDDEVNEDFE